MKRILKGMISWLLVVVMLFTSFPTSVFAYYGADSSEGSDVSLDLDKVYLYDSDHNLINAPSDDDVVYFSLSNDGQYVQSDSTEHSDETLAYVPVKISDVAAINLDTYDLSGYKWESQDYTNKTGETEVYYVTLLQLFIYMNEHYYSGGWDVNVTGSAGSLYMQNGFFGHDENLTYYVDGEYPLQHEGWGATCDHIALEAGDFVDVQMYSDWSFWNTDGAGYRYFIDAQSNEITHSIAYDTANPTDIKLGRAWGNLDIGGATEIVNDANTNVYVTTTKDPRSGMYTSWVTDENGVFRPTAADLAPGTYYLWAEGNTISAPGYAELTVTCSCDHANTEIRNAKEATCTSAGYTGDTYCSDCGNLLEQGSVISKLAHVKGTYHEAVAATCVSKGSVEYWECTGCGQSINTSCALIKDTSTAIDASNHVGTREVKNAKEATESEAGYTGDTYCSACGAVLEEGTVIPSTAAANVISMINALPAADNITLDNEEAVKAACTAYDTLTDEQKTQITEDTLKKLTDAENKIAALKFNDQAPVLKDGVKDVKAKVVVGNAYLLSDLQAGNIFEDPQGDTLSYEGNYFYQKSTDGGETWGGECTFSASLFGATTISIVEKTAGTYKYRFYAKDDSGNSSADNDVYWYLTLTVAEAEDMTFDTSFYVSRDQNYSSNGNVYPIIKVYPSDGKGNITGDAVDFTDSLFGEEAEEGETATPSNTLVDNYNMFYASLKGGWYVYRAYGYNSETKAYDIDLGGMQIKVPMDDNVDGNKGGGTAIYLRLTTLYTNSKKTDNTYFTADDYTIRWTCPLMECDATIGTPYVSGNYTYYPAMLYAGGNSCLYNKYVLPTDSETYCFNQSINATIATGYTVNSSGTLAINAALGFKATVPDTADYALYLQWNNFNTTEVEPKSVVDNEDGTRTYSYMVSKSNANYTWRMTDTTGKYVTKSGWLTGLTAEQNLTYTFDGGATDKHSHTGNLGTVTTTRDEADLQVFLSSTGAKTLTEKTRVRAYRMWQLINSDTANIMIEPDYTWDVLSGNAKITYAEDVEDTDIHGGNSYHNWADITADGTSVIAVNYDSLDVYTDNAATSYGTHGGLYAATDPARTGVIIVTDDALGSAKANVQFNGDFDSNSRDDDWDYIYDTWYYLNTDENPVLTFDTTDAASVSYATVMTDGSSMKSTLSDYTTLTADADGVYTVPLSSFNNEANNYGGTVIIRCTDADGAYSYQLVHVAKMTATVSNASRPGDVLTPGDTAKITFDGLYRSVNKISGIFNPTTFEIRYAAGDTSYSGKTNQYQQLDTTSVSAVIPKDISFDDDGTATYTFTNGYVYGSMYSAANPFSAMYYMTDTGVGTNFNAVTVSYAFQKLADIPVTVSKAGAAITVNVKDKDGAVMTDSQYSMTLTDPDGAVVSPEDGAYNVETYGSYTYEITADGYIKEIGSFDVTSADAAGKTVNIALRESNDSVWDGSAMSEPAIVDEVYQISTGAELAWFANAVNTDKSNKSINGILMNDISLGCYAWTPIGTDTTYLYGGTFDGNGHWVTDLNVSVSTYGGLFGNCTSATIKNLGVSGTATASSTNSYVGGIVGNITGTSAAPYSIDSCINKVTVTGGKYTSGIVGRTQTMYGSVSNCYNAGKVSGSTYVGGITGGGASSSVAVPVSSCYNIGSVISTGTTSGAISGGISATKVTDCYYLADTYSGTSTTQRGTAKTAGELKELAVTLGTAYKSAVCGYPLLTWETDSTVHAMTATAAVEETCTEAGNTAYWTCENCGKYFSDAEGNTEVEKDSWVIPAKNHKLTETEAVAATESDDGNSAYWTCSTCGKYFSDAEGTTEIEKDSWILPHTGCIIAVSSAIGQVTGGDVYVKDANVTLTASDVDGYDFTGWYLGEKLVSENQTYAFKASGDAAYTAVYKANTQLTLTVDASAYTVTVNNESKEKADTYTCTAADKVTVTYTDSAKEFLYWANDYDKVVSKSAAYTFTIGSNTNLHVVCNDNTSAAFVVFLSAYDQIVSAATYTSEDTITIPTAPSKMGCTFTKWVISGTETEATEDAIKAAMTDNATIKVTPVYEADGNQYTINVYSRMSGSDDVQAETYTKKSGDAQELTAEETYNGGSFSYWSDGTKILSYSRNYLVSATSDVTLYAVYSEAVEAAGTSNITAVTKGMKGTKYQLTFTESYSIPDGSTMVKTGLVATTNEAAATADTLILNGANTKTYASSNTTASYGVYSLHANLSDADKIIWMRGYVQYLDKYGELCTVYSDIEGHSYND